MLLARRIAVGGIAAILTALVIGIPTGIIQTSWYHRMTPVLWWNYPVWAMSAILTGTLVATYVRDPALPMPATQGGKTFVGSMLSLFAVGCPICNKLQSEEAEQPGLVEASVVVDPPLHDAVEHAGKVVKGLVTATAQRPRTDLGSHRLHCVRADRGQERHEVLAVPVLGQSRTELIPQERELGVLSRAHPVRVLAVDDARLVWM